MRRSGRKKLLDKLRRLSSQEVKPRPEAPKRIRGHKFAFTGGIPDWPRDSKLYPYVRKLGGRITEIEQIANADCLIHGEVHSRTKTTLKLQRARQHGVPVISEEEFMALLSREGSLRDKERHEKK